jgi:hypothetical protein
MAQIDLGSVANNLAHLLGTLCVSKTLALFLPFRAADPNIRETPTVEKRRAAKVPKQYFAPARDLD